jgi:hypothetical protein
LAWGQNNATLTLNKKEFSCESYLVEGNYYFYSPEIVPLQAQSSYHVTLEFQFTHEGKIVSHKNYKKHKLQLDFISSSQLVTTPEVSTKKGEIKLQIQAKAPEEQIDTLSISITDEQKNMLIKYQFPIKITTKILLTSQGDDFLNNIKNKANQKPPITLELFHYQTSKYYYFPIDSLSSISIPLIEDNEYLLNFRFDHNSLKEVKLITTWIGKG